MLNLGCAMQTSSNAVCESRLQKSESVVPSAPEKSLTPALATPRKPSTTLNSQMRIWDPWICAGVVSGENFEVWADELDKLRPQ